MRKLMMATALVALVLTTATPAAWADSPGIEAMVAWSGGGKPPGRPPAHIDFSFQPGLFPLSPLRPPKRYCP